MRRSFPVLLLLALGAASVQAFIPPVSELLNEVFSGRKPAEALELQFRHQVQVRDGEFLEVIETFSGGRNDGIVQWSQAGQPSVFCDWNAKEYMFRNGKSIPSRTSAFIEYFLAANGSEYQSRLLKEKFLRRDQLAQFKASFNPTGDPKTWETKANYLLHDDVSIQKLPREFAVAVLGTNTADEKRAFYISRRGHGISRLEWLSNGESAAWDFAGFAPIQGLGHLPRVFSLQINGSERVKSTLVLAKSVRRDSIATTRAASRQPSSAQAPTSVLEEAIRLIVRYR